MILEFLLSNFATIAATICYRLLTGAQELMTRVRITLTYSMGSIKRRYKIPTEMKMIENTHKNLCGCPFQHCTGKKHKRVPFSFPH